MYASTHDFDGGPFAKNYFFTVKTTQQIYLIPNRTLGFFID